ncbi:hypothetical protein AVDCRST_MAG94-2337 [uncultured Leptolyngbya sp.]|uniref:Uncharacterized protein n=1 Tax=uncultured Leptolyngbya sp. TaxID=332963 RepID=A0A6J4LUT8_9CYAN|nr:hypothetical protein AVDCRST_MAG94-2337 [uncultured Leptolyngbya sp.]
MYGTKLNDIGTNLCHQANLLTARFQALSLIVVCLLPVHAANQTSTEINFTPLMTLIWHYDK